MEQIIVNLNELIRVSAEKEKENDSFKEFLLRQDPVETDRKVQVLNDSISPRIDCTKCGNCCKSLMINVSEKETSALAVYLEITDIDFKEQYLEISEGGKMIMNRIPCHFLKENKCTVYDHRFSGCREFPHLDEPGFTGRLFSIFMYYPVCPIIFNVMEALKTTTGFNN